MNVLTIFTPTYNRAWTLPVLYESLKEQTCSRFEWLIVDDGSCDNTEELITGYSKEGSIDIRYYKQGNSGKHIAHNTGVELAQTELFVCVDSDDWLDKNAVQYILEEWENSRNDGICGLVGAKSMSGHDPGRSWPSNVRYATQGELYGRYGFKGETILVFRTDIIKRYLFPSFQNEKFVTEAVVYDRIDKSFKYKLINKILYYGYYLEDGYTKQGLKLFAGSPKGYALYLKQRAGTAIGILMRTRYAAQFFAWCRVFSLDRYEFEGYKTNRFYFFSARILMWYYEKKFSRLR